MGRLAGPYGLRGFVRVQVFTEALDGLLDFEEWLVGRQGRWDTRRVLEADVHGDGLVARFEGIDTPEAARALRGSDVAVRRGELPPPEADEVYWVDLIGCEVVNREGIRLGHVANLMETGANDVLVVVAGSGEQRVERLIPYTAQVVEQVDVPGRSIRVDWGEDY
ncbi:MAG: ribosome maturation factor RimM [Rhodocyclaceae bacterium]|nr:ribosome maturation factor RimM [Rhodocyclaceae bacterium]